MCGHGVGDDVIVEVAGRHPIHHREQCRLRIGRAVIAREGAIVPVPGTRERVRSKWPARNRSEDLARAVRVIDRERLAVAATTDLYFASAAKVDVVGEFDSDWWVAERRRREYGKHQGGQGEQHGSSVVGWVSTTGGQSKSVPGNDVTRCDIPGTDVFAARPASVSRRGQVSYGTGKPLGTDAGVSAVRSRAAGSVRALRNATSSRCSVSVNWSGVRSWKSSVRRMSSIVAWSPW